MKKANFAPSAAWFLIVCAGCSGVATTSIQQRNEPNENRNIAATSNNRQGMIVHIDPSTGEFISETPEQQKSRSSAESAEPSVPEPIEMLSPVAGGGIMVESNGQFDTPLAATVDPSGNITVKHQATTASGAEKMKRGEQ